MRNLISFTTMIPSRPAWLHKTRAYCRSSVSFEMNMVHLQVPEVLEVFLGLFHNDLVAYPASYGPNVPIPQPCTDQPINTVLFRCVHN
jgi:hypothetical protein